MCGRVRRVSFASGYLAALGAQLLAGCGSGSAPPAGPRARRFAGLEFGPASDQAVYAPGQIIPLTLTITNVSYPAAVFTSAPPDVPIFTFQAARAGGATLLCGGGSGNTLPPIVTFDPKIPEAFTCGWDQTSPATVAPVAPGVYQIQAFLNAGTLNGVPYTQAQAQSELAANPIEITISSR